MILSISGQTLIFLIAAACGGGAGLVFDVFRVLRRMVKHNTVFVQLEDILFWITAALGVFLVNLIIADGLFRGYIIMGFALGIVIYFAAISPFVLMGLLAAAKFIVGLIAWIVGLILMPIKWLIGLLKKFGAFTKKKARGAYRRTKPTRDRLNAHYSNAKSRVKAKLTPKPKKPKKRRGNNTTELETTIKNPIRREEPTHRVTVRHISKPKPSSQSGSRS